jgi:hypothetical protein
MRSESTPSLEFDRLARFAMTPLLKLRISSHLRIQRLRSTLPKHPEFAVSGCICYGYKTPESPLYLAFLFSSITITSNPINFDYTDHSSRLPNVKSGLTDLGSARQMTAWFYTSERTWRGSKDGQDMPVLRARELVE